ncbi:hypothetical protein H0H92_002925 [Tricholoma furcatifolium]|nr:hypothetical protein H0H92_002925 [Tricholoma furcatifolium]
MNSQAEILFWKVDGDEDAQTFTVKCKEYPLFKLGDCPDSVLAALNLSPSPALIETFHPVMERWTHHDLDTLRNLANGPKTFLY